MSRSTSSLRGLAALALAAALSAGCEEGRCVRHSDCVSPLICLATACVPVPTDADADAAVDATADTGAATDVAGDTTSDAASDAASDIVVDASADAAADAAGDAAADAAGDVAKDVTDASDADLDAAD